MKQVDKWTQSQGYSKSTVQHRLDALRRILDIAVDNKMVPHNVARTSKWKRNKQADNPRRGIKDEEIDALFDAVEKDTAMAALLGGSMEIALWLGRYLGLRNSEAVNLPWTQYELDDGILKIPDRILHPDGTCYYPKTSGDMPLADELVERLRDWKYRQEQGIFATKTRYTRHQKGHAFVLGGPAKRTRSIHAVGNRWTDQGVLQAAKESKDQAWRGGIQPVERGVLLWIPAQVCPPVPQKDRRRRPRAGCKDGYEAYAPHHHPDATELPRRPHTTNQRPQTRSSLTTKATSSKKFPMEEVALNIERTSPFLLHSEHVP